MAIVEREKRNGTITFQVKVKDGDGNWFPTPSFTDRVDAETEELRLEQLKRKGAKAISGDAKRVSVDEYWEVWSVENRQEVSAGWQISQNQMYRDYAKPVIGELKLIEVDPPVIGKILKRAQDQGLSAQTRKHIYSLLRKMFTDAVEYYEMLATNPVRAKFHRPKVASKKRMFLLPAQAWRLLEASKDSFLGPSIWVQTLSALRPEAMQGLQWKSVLWDLDQILICRAWKQKVGVMADYPKNDDWDYVPMPQALKSYLWQRRIASSAKAEDFVCQGPKGGMISYDTYCRALPRLCKKVGVPRVTPHELRHTCTEIYMQAGASAEDIRRLLNHASLSATKGYIHRTPERLSHIAGSIGTGESFPNSFPNGKKETFVAPVIEVPNVH